MSQDNEYNILHLIESVAEAVIQQLDEFKNPELQCGSIIKRFNYLNQSKSIASILLVLNYCYSLYPRTTTTREVYYYYVTHFRSQRECDQAIADCCALLNVPRHALGLHASSRGWFYGRVRVYNAQQEEELKWDASCESCPITSDWLRFQMPMECSECTKCILVVEKEGIFQRLVEDQLQGCIIVTGKGFPDLATRQAVLQMHDSLRLPVFGLADCDPYGVLVLNTYINGGIPLQWLGLRPSQIHNLSQKEGLPEAVFQELTSGDQSRLEGLIQDVHPLNAGDLHLEELEAMRTTKVELEALHWLGMEFCADFVAELIGYALSHDVDDGEDRELWMEAL